MTPKKTAKKSLDEKLSEEQIAGGIILGSLTGMATGAAIGLAAPGVLGYRATGYATNGLEMEKPYSTIVQALGGAAALYFLAVPAMIVGAAGGAVVGALEGEEIARLYEQFKKK